MLATWQIRDAATKQRKRLRKAGYLPIPAVGKAPSLPGWQNVIATDAEIDDWFRQYPEALNTGVLTCRSPAVALMSSTPRSRRRSRNCCGR